MKEFMTHYVGTLSAAKWLSTVKLSRAHLKEEH
ncbi:hypothetical protein LCGC14_0228810 [marine sediment metagenome]|uniref:Uncharacterized protein n=1 Tax=marine sediment metagenome TaxID=412755 RepID=A0A0F9USQ7_9ZZZZ